MEITTTNQITVSFRSNIIIVNDVKNKRIA